ncbi:hypothetical protein ACET93_20485 [Aeromonas veronii]
MRLLPLCWLLGMTPALAAPVQLKLLEWGYLPAGYEQKFADYAKAHGVEATVSRIEPLLFSVLLSLGKSPALFASGEMLADKTLQQEVEQQLSQRLRASRGFWFNQANRCEDLRQQTFATTWGLELVECNKQNEQQWRIAMVQEGAIYALDALSIARHVGDDPARLKAAYLLVDFLLSAPLQRQMLVGTPTISASNIASRPPLSPQEQAVLPDRPLPEFDERLLVPALPAHIKNRYKRMVQQAIVASGKEGLVKQCPWDLDN